MSVRDREAYKIDGSTPIPHRLADLARRRSEPFLTIDAIQTRPLGHILAECYIQGLRDASKICEARLK